MQLGSSLVLLCASLHLGCAARANDCDVTLVRQALESGKTAAAMPLLDSCAIDKLPSEALHAMITWYEAGSYDASDLRMSEAMLTLLTREALNGNEDAIFSLAGIYEEGDSVLSIPADPATSSCLVEIAESADTPLRADVEQCLSD